MEDERYSLLGIPSADAEAVSRILQPPVQERPYYSDPGMQSLSDFHAQQGRNWQQEQDLNQQADLERNISMPTMGGDRARQMAWKQAVESALYEKKAKALMEDLHKLDPGDPEHLSHQEEVIAKHPISREALKDPRIAGIVKRQAAENEEMTQIFDRDNEARQEYATLRANGVAPQEARETVRRGAQTRAERVAFAAAGGKPEEFDKLVRPDGMVDKAALAYSISQLKNAPKQQMTALEARQLDEAAKGIAEINDRQKASAFHSVHGKDPETEEEWRVAWNLANEALEPEREAVASIVQDLEAQGKVVPNRYKKLSGIVEKEPSVPRPNLESSTPNATPASGRAKVTTRAEYDALPSGTLYQGSDGKTYRKK